MKAGKHHLSSCLEVGVAIRPLPGESVCGDAFLVKAIAEDVLVAVIDGAGHGPEAAAASETAIAVIEAHAGESMVSLIERCHAELARSRGAAMTLLLVRPAENAVCWLGVGNVLGYLIHPVTGAKPRSEMVLLRGGIVGYRLPPLRSREVTITPGDWLVVTTDGIGPDWNMDLDFLAPPTELAQTILQRHHNGSDDALVLAARYQGSEPS